MILSEESKIKLYTHVDILMWTAFGFLLPIIGYLFLELNNNFDKKFWMLGWMFGIFLILFFISFFCSFKEICSNLKERIEEDNNKSQWMFGHRYLRGQFNWFFLLLFFIWIIWWLLLYFKSDITPLSSIWILIFFTLNIILITYFRIIIFIKDT